MLITIKMSWMFASIMQPKTPHLSTQVTLWEIVFTETHYFATKTQKTTHIQLLCNYPLGITTIIQLSP
jgi:hypothetical protein